jgi:tRNA(fMet)-specific endonuclease VapC
LAVNPILLDTNAYAALKRGHAEAIRIVQRAPFIAISSTVLGELLGGFAFGTREAQNRQELEMFLASPRVTLHSIDRATAERYAVLFASLRAAGTPIPTNDLWIAASALQHALVLFTFDAHFRNVPGLRVGATVAELSTP